MRTTIVVGMLVSASACSGSSFQVTSGREAIGRPDETRVSCREMGFERIADRDGLVTVETPADWSRVERGGVIEAVHPKDAMVARASGGLMASPTAELDALKARVAAEHVVLEDWTSSESDGISTLRASFDTGRSVLVARIRVRGNGYALGELETFAPFDESCRPVLSRILSSVDLVRPEPAADVAPAPAPKPATPVQLKPRSAG